MNWKKLLSFIAAGTLTAFASAAPGQFLVDLESPYSASGKDDVAKLQDLMRGIGWEFSPNEQTDTMLRYFRMHTLRCINVEALEGHFNEEGKYIVEKTNSRMMAHLITCKRTSMIPHIIVGTWIPDQLKKDVKVEGNKENLLGNAGSTTVGPTDLNLYKNYCLAFFEYWVINQDVRNAEFEVFNEPDIGGIAAMRVPKPTNGSKAAYDDMFKLYAAWMQAKKEFEEAHPGIKLTVGAPALAWCYTFAFGDFNWGTQFVKDCAEKNIKPDFIGIHFYGNIGPVKGPSAGFYPSYRDMVRSLSAQVNKYLPGTPIQVNEWGPSYHTGNNDSGMFNATIEGAAWALDFLTESVALPIDSMIYLVTTDLTVMDEQKKLTNGFGWCSLWLNPTIHPGPVPKVMFHTFSFIHELNGERVLVNNIGNVRCFAVRGKKKVQLLFWNTKLDIKESGKIVDHSEAVKLDVVLRHGPELFGTEKAKVSATTISAFAGDVVSNYLRTGKVDPKAAERPAPVVTEATPAGFKLDMPANSIMFVEIEPVK